MYDLLRAAMRQRPEYIIVGEVRGKEALTLFQAMNTGHTTYSTMHAGSIQAVVNRLLNEPINVPNMMLQSLNIVSIQELVFVSGQKLRRTRSVVEITGIDPRTNNLRINELYRWNTMDDTYEVMGESVVMTDIMTRRGWDRARLKQELANRIKVLSYLHSKGIRDYRKVTIAINAYYVMPAQVLEMIEKDEFERMIESDSGR
jgi:flagellar protein FlaI